MGFFYLGAHVAVSFDWIFHGEAEAIAPTAKGKVKTRWSMSELCLFPPVLFSILVSVSFLSLFLAFSFCQNP